ncbi:hypothetical protein [Bacillus haynesii]|uniref:hypothetical protein n=1 Tax=Bacillus haynesii TaxID=1925021 RepID=UPI0022811E67|nr:hypothetical protein [Bacillus haynesii]MCY9372724.1 hypothetical protein [Bacillus haynesii]
MKWIYKYDENFIYLPGEERELADGEALPEFYTDVKPPDGLYLPKYSTAKNKWVESATQEYIDGLQPPPPEPSEVEVLQKQVADLYYLIALGGA